MDLFDQVEAYLESVTNIPHLLVLVLSFGLLILLSHSLINGFRAAVKKRKPGLLAAILAVVGFISLQWADATFGALLLLAAILIALRKPIKALFSRRARSKETDA